MGVRVILVVFVRCRPTFEYCVIIRYLAIEYQDVREYVRHLQVYVDAFRENNLPLDDTAGQEITPKRVDLHIPYRNILKNLRFGIWRGKFHLNFIELLEKWARDKECVWLTSEVTRNEKRERRE